MSAVRTYPFFVEGELVKARAASLDKARGKAIEIWRDRKVGVVKRVKANRETGTEIVLVDRSLVDGGPEGDGNDARWQIECVAHGSVCSMDTRGQAEGFMAEPTTWCEDCQAAFSTDGSGSWNDFNTEEDS